jgi:signal transduction histidine kinase
MIPIMRSIERQKQFTADASHELRTPLSVLRSSVEILEEQEHRLPEVHRTVLSHMKEEVERMTRLTGQLLMLARRFSGMEQLAAVRFDLQACVRSAVDRMELAARKKQIQIRFAGGDRSDPLHYTGDADQISQLLYILLDNAVKYSYPGGTVTVQACRREDGIEIEVRDEGCGIPKKDIPHLFERFYRVDKARARELGGSGLGLTIADAIVRNHGGSIAVSSEMNRGSRFVIHLPRLDQR